MTDAKPKPAPAPTTPATPKTTTSRTANITNNAGGVMTEEVGVITGDLTLRSELREDSTVVLKVQYRDADEWYTVTGGGTKITDPAVLDTVHQLAVALLNRAEG